ncbi:MAG: 3-oxoacyl-[acyl-carrier-protein] reductase [Planctomycetota bacterium]|nr:3-oxoacyl-[acyl-carrier-protein] reductase [Planctomycetota bacterium]
MSTNSFGLTADLTGQIALVTGASQGLGHAVAVRLGANGAKVLCVARNAEKLADTVARIQALGGEAVAMACDVTNRESIEKLFEQVETDYKRLDILVNNAGITRDTLLPRMTDVQWDEIIAANLTSCFLFSRAATRIMMGQRYGRIINMSSVSGLIGNAGQTNYSATKAGMIGFTRSLSKEMAKRKITVNAVAPGFIESEMTKALGDSIIDEVKKRVPANRLGTGDDVAACVLFLASRAASYVTGQVITVDGGMTG